MVKELCDGEFEHCCDVFTTLSIVAYKLICEKLAALENHENGLQTVFRFVADRYAST
jgi:hypothetical protein